MQPAITFRDVAYQIGGRAVLQGLSFVVQPGQVVALLGASGAGKTTALQMVNRMLTPNSGAVEVLGRDVQSWDPFALRQGIGYAMQQDGLFPHWTVERNLGLVPSLAGWEAGRIAARVAELLERFQLPPAEFAQRYPHQLSGGQRQRVGIARAVAAKPAVLLLDEPFAALDPVSRLAAQKQFLALREPQSAALLVTHDFSEASRLAHRVLLLEAGRIILDCPSEELATHPDPALSALREAASLSRIA